MENFFKDSELRCACCGNSRMDDAFMVKLNQARAASEIPFVITSAWRCVKHNIDVGSHSTNHPSGKAVDIRCKNGADRFVIVKALLGAGMLGIGIGKSFVHCDTNREMPVIFLY